MRVEQDHARMTGEWIKHAHVLRGHFATQENGIALVETKLDFNRDMKRLRLLRLLNHNLRERVRIVPVERHAKLRCTGPFGPVIEESL